MCAPAQHTYFPRSHTHWHYTALLHCTQIHTTTTTTVGRYWLFTAVYHRQSTLHTICVRAILAATLTTLDTAVRIFVHVFVELWRVWARSRVHVLRPCTQRTYIFAVHLRWRHIHSIVYIPWRACEGNTYIRIRSITVRNSQARHSRTARWMSENFLLFSRWQLLRRRGSKLFALHLMPIFNFVSFPFWLTINSFGSYFVTIIVCLYVCLSSDRSTRILRHTNPMAFQGDR